MPNVLGLIGYNQSGGSATNKLLAGFVNDIVDVTAGTGFGLAISSTNDIEFAAWLDRIFMQNYSTSPKTFNGTVWSREYVGRTLLSKYLYPLKSRMYLAYCSFDSPQAPLDTGSNAITFPSRIFYSDLFQGNTLTWGIEWGRNGSTISNTSIFEVTTTGGTLVQDFQATGIKIGDPLFITNGNAQLTSDKPYFVTSIVSPYRLLVDRLFPVTATGQHFWVGSNWLDVSTDDGDYLTGLGENDDKLLVFKQFSLYRYNQVSLQKVKDAPGTTYSRSVVNIGDLTLYFHGSNINTRKTGFYAYNGGKSSLISRGIQPYIDGIAASGYRSIVAWREGTKYRGYVGTITNTPRNISVTNGVCTLDTAGGQWSIDPITDTVTARGKWVQSSAEKWFIGTNDNQVMETASGNSHNGTDISWALEKGVKYPSTSSVANTYTRVQVTSRDAKGVQVLYKLIGTPADDDDQWTGLGEIQHNQQEFNVPIDNNYGRGINFRFAERGQRANVMQIQKIVGFYIPQTSKIL